jgi:energy-coupling factor transporter transmembrane protein EcfT
MSTEVEEKPSKLSFYWMSIFILFIIIDLLKHYFSCIKFIKPIILFVILFTIMAYEINSECKFEKFPTTELTNRSVLLLSAYLYSEYTVKCVPVINLTISKLFQYPQFGSILKTSLSYLIMYLSNHTMNMFGDPIFENKICSIKSNNTNLIYSISILGIILLNSYLETFIK